MRATEQVDETVQAEAQNIQDQGIAQDTPKTLLHLCVYSMTLYWLISSQMMMVYSVVAEKVMHHLPPAHLSLGTHLVCVCVRACVSLCLCMSVFVPLCLLACPLAHRPSVRCGRSTPLWPRRRRLGST